MQFSSQLITNTLIGRNPVFRWLAAGSGLNSAGMQGEQVIVGLLVYQLTQSSAWVGISLALFFAPMLFVGVPAGALADRYDRRTVLIWTELALCAALSIFAMLLIADTVRLPGALAISVISGVLRSLHHPARLSYTGDIAGNNRLVSALGVLSILTRFGQLFGALSAGFISHRYGPGSAYAMLAIGHLLALYCFYKTASNLRQINATVKPTGTLKAIAEYLNLLRSSTTLILLITFTSLIEIFGFSFATAMPEIAVQRLALDADGLGLMHAARAAGGLFGAVLLSTIIIKVPGQIYLLVMIGFGLALITLSSAPQLWSVLFAVALVAVFASSVDILSQCMLQLCVPNALRGRAMGAWVVALGMGPIGHLELGLLISLAGTTAALAVNGIILILIGMAALLSANAIGKIRAAD